MSLTTILFLNRIKYTTISLWEGRIFHMLHLRSKLVCGFFIFTALSEPLAGGQVSPASKHFELCRAIIFAVCHFHWYDRCPFVVVSFARSSVSCFFYRRRTGANWERCWWRWESLRIWPRAVTAQPSRGVRFWSHNGSLAVRGLCELSMPTRKFRSMHRESSVTGKIGAIPQWLIQKLNSIRSEYY